MTQQPQIKKYRRRVSDERIERAAEAIFTSYASQGKSGATWDTCFSTKRNPWLMLAKAALEADAEVIEVKPYNNDTMLLDYGGSVCDVINNEQFNAEWEEVK